MDAYNCIYCLCPCCYDILCFICVHDYIHIIHTYSDGAFWWAIYRIVIGHLSDTYDWLHIYIIYTTTDAHAYRCLF